MSTEYRISDNLILSEVSCNFKLIYENPKTGGRNTVETLSPKRAEQMIVSLVKAVSYATEDPETFVQKFNVSYFD